MVERTVELVEVEIGNVARQAGVATSAIRYYEEIGLLPPAARRAGRRRYDASTLQRLQVIGYAQQAGFTLGEIRELFFGFAVGTRPEARWEALAHRNWPSWKSRWSEFTPCRGYCVKESIAAA